MYLEHTPNARTLLTCRTTHTNAYTVLKSPPNPPPSLYSPFTPCLPRIRTAVYTIYSATGKNPPLVPSCPNPLSQQKKHPSLVKPIHKHNKGRSQAEQQTENRPPRRVQTEGASRTTPRKTHYGNPPPSPPHSPIFTDNQKRHPYLKQNPYNRQTDLLPCQAGENRPPRRIAAARTVGDRKGWWASARRRHLGNPCQTPPCRTALIKIHPSNQPTSSSISPAEIFWIIRAKGGGGSTGVEGGGGRNRTRGERGVSYCMHT